MFQQVISLAAYWVLLPFNTLSEIKPLFDAWHLQGLFSLQGMPAKLSAKVAGIFGYEAGAVGLPLVFSPWFFSPTQPRPCMVHFSTTPTVYH